MKRLLLLIFFVFAIQFTFSQQLTFAMYFEDAAGNKDTIILGYDQNASSGIDANFGEINIMGQSLKQGLDVRISDASADFFEIDSGTFELKKQIIHYNCNGWQRANCIEIGTKNWPVTVSWNKTLFQNNCNYATFFTSFIEFPCLGGMSNLGFEYLKDTTTRTFSPNCSDQFIIGRIQETDTISYFWQAFVDSTTWTIGINDPKYLTNNPFINVFPNPTTTYITIDLTENISNSVQTIQLYNLQGKLIKQQKIQPNQSQLTIDVQDLKAGMYFGKIISESGESESFKFVKE